MRIQEIQNAIDRDFAKVYRGASGFVNSGPLWDFCMRKISDPVSLTCIVFANDMGVPPVRSLLTMYAREFHPDPGFRFSGQESQSMGALMGFVFKYVLGYRQQKERCTVQHLGVHTATRFLDGPIHVFEA